MTLVKPYKSMKRSYDSEMTDIGRKFGMSLRSQSVSNVALVQATVEAVNEGEGTVDVVMSDGHSLSGISLDVVPNGNSSILVFPLIGSMVVLGFVENRPELAYISSFTNVDRMQIRQTLGEEDENIIDITKDYVEVRRKGAICKIEDKVVSLDCGDNGTLKLASKATLNSLASVLLDLVDLASTQPYSGFTTTATIADTPVPGTVTATPNPAIQQKANTLNSNINKDFE